MNRSVYVETHTEVVEPPGLFDHFDSSSAYPVRYRIYFEFQEERTLVYSKNIYLSISPQDKFFRLRLLETFEKEIKNDNQFKFTKWGEPTGIEYDYTLEDFAGILGWMEKKHLVALLTIEPG